MENSIAERNDLCRKTFMFCKVLLTPGVNALDEKTRSEVLEKVQQFDDFNEDNDPYGEHDFGSVEVNGNEYFFKFDFFDDKYLHIKEDGNRVLTIMKASEY